MNSKIFSLNKLIQMLRSKRSKTVVLVTGCFDILHQAHKSFLQKAKKQGNMLIVGLEQDKRVRFLKGKERPVNSLQKRMKNLADLNIADFIFSLPLKFNRDKDYMNLLKKIKPGILAVSENTPFLKKKQKMIDKINGLLFIFPFNPKFSSTKLIKDNNNI